MAFYMDVSDLLNEFGQDIKVWSPPTEPIQSYPGGPTTGGMDLSEDNAELRHEPVVPISSKSSIGAQLLAGGFQLQGMLAWYSTDKFPAGTIVEVPNQDGRYEVQSFGNYTPYAKFHEYVLKGVSQDDINNV